MARAYKITAADIMDLPDVYRDKIAKGTRIKYHVSLENTYQRNKHRPHEQNSRIELVSGPKGAGKTTFASFLGKRSYEYGRPVFSNAGLLFGYRLPLNVSIYNVINECPENAHLIIDATP